MFRLSLYELGKAPVIIQIAFLFIVIAVVITVISYTLILAGRLRGYYYDLRMKKLFHLIDDYVTENVIFLNGPEDIEASETVNLNLESLLKKPFNTQRGRQALIKRLMDYRKKVRGAKGELIVRLFREAGLEQESLKKLHSGQWNLQEQALNELTTMGIEVADIDIFPLTVSRNRELRNAARHAYVKLSKNDAFRFFDVMNEPLLLWEQIELFKIITTTEGIAIPNFARWINYSSNSSLVSFCLKLVIHYQQLSAIPAVIKQLSTRNHDLRNELIACLGTLKVEEAEETLVGMYSTQPLKCQIRILKAIGDIGSGKQLQFLTDQFLFSREFDIKMNAVKALLANNWRTGDILQKLNETALPGDRIFLQHCTNRLIRY